MKKTTLFRINDFSYADRKITSKIKKIIKKLKTNTEVTFMSLNNINYIYINGSIKKINYAKFLFKQAGIFGRQIYKGKEKKIKYLTKGR